MSSSGIFYIMAELLRVLGKGILQRYKDKTVTSSVELAFNNDHVRQALASSDWFTPDYIIDIHNTEEVPVREGLGPYTDTQLQSFFDKSYKVEKGNEVYLGVRKYLCERMISPDGHPLPLHDISFADETFMAFARELGATESYEVDRGMIGEVDSGLLCLIAPEEIRRKVVKVTQDWGEGYEGRKRDVLLWSALVKRGAKAYLARQNPIRK